MAERLLNILVVDDESLARQSIIAMLHTIGFDQVAEADNGVDALSCIIKHNIDIVLADIEMPDLDGLTLLERIKNHELACAVIFISGHDSFKYAQKAITLGASNYLLKPISAEELYNALNALIGRFAFGEDVQKPHFVKDGYSMKIIEKAQDYIKKNIRQDVTLNTIAEHVYLSPSYFSKMFKELSGEKFTDYLTRVRIDAAKQLLSEQLCRTKEISRMVGFHNEKYFYKVFRRYTGLTPSEYRAYIFGKEK